MRHETPIPSPYAWLWAELERRFGADVTSEIKADYLKQNRAHQHTRWHAPESPPQPRAKRPKRGGHG